MIFYFNCLPWLYSDVLLWFNIQLNLLFYVGFLCWSSFKFNCFLCFRLLHCILTSYSTPFLFFYLDCTLNLLLLLWPTYLSSFAFLYDSTSYSEFTPYLYFGSFESSALTIYDFVLLTLTLCLDSTFIILIPCFHLSTYRHVDFYVYLTFIFNTVFPIFLLLWLKVLTYFAFILPFMTFYFELIHWTILTSKGAWGV